MTRRTWLSGGVAALACALAACGGDTEILVKVTRDATAPAAIPRLRVYAAVDTGQDMGTARVFVDQSDAQAEVDVSSRDLAADPYTLAIKPGARLPDNAQIEIAALGFELDSAGDPKALAFGRIDRAISFTSGQVLSYDVALAALPSGGVGVDVHGCLEFQSGDLTIHIGSSTDWDCDGDPHGTDCNDLDPVINHMASEVCGNAVDEDCSGAVDDDTDADGDGITACKGDCIDNPGAILPPGLTATDVHPGAAERPDNAIDENCDGACAVADNLDTDKDHYTTTGLKTDGAVAGRCKRAAALTDCNDVDGNINPGQTENASNGIDDDCDGKCDTDVDGDGYTVSGFLEPPGADAHCKAVGNGRSDCDDDPTNDPATGPLAKDIHPDAPDTCDGIDENCDGLCDDDADSDKFSVCGPVTGPTCVVQSNACMPNQPCDCAPDVEAVHPVRPGEQPVPERCDGYDENCDGVHYPADNQCFVAGASGTECYAGKRQCDDTSVQMPWGPCAADLSQPVDPALCAAYDICFADPAVADPFACAGPKANLGVITCSEKVSGGTTACAPNALPLKQLIATASCAAATWTVFGGPTHGAWTVGFSNGSGGVSDSAIGCTATLTVTAYDHNASTQTTTPILITQAVPGQAASVVVTLTAAGTVTCPGLDGNLVCAGP